MDCIDEQDLICPISQQIMLDPVTAPDGQNYERIEIEKWLKTKKTSPFTRKAMTGTTADNRLLKRIITDYLKKNPDKIDEQYVDVKYYDVASQVHVNNMADFAYIIKNHKYYDINKYFRAVCKYGTSTQVLIMLTNVPTVNINSRSISGCTAILYVSQKICFNRENYRNNDDVELIMKLLIDRGVDVNIISTQYRIAPIHCVIGLSDIKYMNILIEAGADVNISSEYVSPPLVYLAQTKQHLFKERSQILIDNGANINALGTDNENVLYSICKSYMVYDSNDSYEIIRYLLNIGVNVKYQTPSGNTVLVIDGLMNRYKTLGTMTGTRKHAFFASMKLILDKTYPDDN